MKRKLNNMKTINNITLGNTVYCVNNLTILNRRSIEEITKDKIKLINKTFEYRLIEGEESVFIDSWNNMAFLNFKDAINFIKENLVKKLNEKRLKQKELDDEINELYQELLSYGITTD